MGPDDTNWPCERNFGRDAFVVHPSGAPLIAFTDSDSDFGLTVRRWSGSYWYTVGEAGFANSLDHPCLAIASWGGVYVAYQDQEYGHRITVRQWSGGAWQLIGTPGFTIGQATPSGLEINAQGRPVVAFSDGTQGDRASVWHWTGVNWEPIGSPGFSTGAAGYIDLALDSEGEPVVAYSDNAYDNRTTVQRWSGSNWDFVGSPGFSPESAYSQNLVLDPADDPVVIYKEGGVSYINQSTVQRWNGTSWEFVGDRGFSNGWARSQDIAIGSSGQPVAAYLADSFDGYRLKVQNWNGTSWQQLGAEVGPQGVSSLGLRVAPSGAPMVAFTNVSYGGRETVQQWDGDSWVVFGDVGFSVESDLVGANKIYLDLDTSGAPMVVYSDAAYNDRLTMQRWNGSSWQRIGPPGFASGSLSFSFKIDVLGRPVVAHQDGTFGRASVRRWNGSSWELIGPAQFSEMQASHLILALDAGGDPVVAYKDVANGNKTTVQRWNGTAWELLGQAGFTPGPASYQRLAVDPSGTPILAHVLSSLDLARVEQWNGASWVTMGSFPLNTQSPSPFSVILDQTGSPIVAYNSNLGITVKRWTGNAWALIGSEGVASDNANSLSLALDTAGLPMLAYQDGGATVQRWNGSFWEVVGSQQFTSVFTSSSYQWARMNDQGRIYVAFVCGGAYAKTYPEDTTGLLELEGPAGSDSITLSIGPNPNSGQELQVCLAGLPFGLSTVQLELFDPSGRHVGAQVLPAQQGEVNAKFMLPPGLPSGLYIVFASAGDTRWMSKLVISKQ